MGDSLSKILEDVKKSETNFIESIAPYSCEETIKSNLDSLNPSDQLIHEIEQTLSEARPTENPIFKKALNRIEESKSKLIESIQPPFSNDYQSSQIEHLRSMEEKRLRPFEYLGKRLDNLIETSTKSAEFTIESNKDQLNIATEIKKEIKISGDSSSKFSEKTIKLNYVVIFLTVVSLFLGYYSLTNNGTVDAILTFNKSIDDLTIKLTSLSESSQNVYQNQFATFLKTQKAERQEFISLFKQQNLDIERLKKKNEEQLRMIETLNIQLDIIKTEKKNSGNSGINKDLPK